MSSLGPQHILWWAVQVSEDTRDSIKFCGFVRPISPHRAWRPASTAYSSQRAACACCRPGGPPSVFCARSYGSLDREKPCMHPTIYPLSFYDLTSVALLPRRGVARHPLRACGALSANSRFNRLWRPTRAVRVLQVWRPARSVLHTTLWIAEQTPYAMHPSKLPFVFVLKVFEKLKKNKRRLLLICFTSPCH